MVYASAATALCGIVLHPAGHTRSPAMHEAAFRALGIDARYVAFDVPPERLADALRGARALGIRQLAVSLPHKEAVMLLVDRVEETDDLVSARGEGLGGETDLEDLGEEAHVSGGGSPGAAPGAWSACR